MSQFFQTISSTGPIPPVIATSYVTNSGTAVPALNVLNVLGTTVAAGSIPFRFIGSGNTVTGQVQISQAISSTDATKIGLSAYDSNYFSVDANGFVSIILTPSNLHYTLTSALIYVVIASDEYIAVDSTANTVTVELPNTTTTGRVITVKDRSGTALTHAITVTTVGGAVTIDGATSQVFNETYESLRVIFNGTNYEVF
jgi:hypothetical protein